MVIAEHLKYHANSVTKVVRGIVQERPGNRRARSDSINHKKFEQKQKCLSCIFALLTLLFAAIFIVACYELSNEWEPTKEDSSVVKTYWKHVLSLLIIGWLVSLPGRDEQLPYLKFSKVWTYFWLFLIALFFIGLLLLAEFEFSSPSQVLIYIFAMFISSFVLTYCCSHYYLQFYDPFIYNEKYQLARRIHKNDEISIVSSRAFEIVLENRSTEPWSSSKGFEIRRKIKAGQRACRTIIPLPKDIVILPGHTATLIPYTEEEPFNAKKIHGFRCFNYDVAENILTTVNHSDRNKAHILARLEEQFDRCSPQKWAEITETFVANGLENKVQIL